LAAAALGGFLLLLLVIVRVKSMRERVGAWFRVHPAVSHASYILKIVLAVAVAAGAGFLKLERVLDDFPNSHVVGALYVCAGVVFQILLGIPDRLEKDEFRKELQHESDRAAAAEGREAARAQAHQRETDEITSDLIRKLYGQQPLHDQLIRLFNKRFGRVLKALRGDELTQAQVALLGDLDPTEHLHEILRACRDTVRSRHELVWKFEEPRGSDSTLARLRDAAGPGKRLRIAMQRPNESHYELTGCWDGLSRACVNDDPEFWARQFPVAASGSKPTTITAHCGASNGRPLVIIDDTLDPACIGDLPLKSITDPDPIRSLVAFRVWAKPGEKAPWAVITLDHTEPNYFRRDRDTEFFRLLQEVLGPRIRLEMFLLDQISRTSAASRSTVHPKMRGRKGAQPTQEGPGLGEAANSLTAADGRTTSPSLALGHSSQASPGVDGGAVNSPADALPAPGSPALPRTGDSDIPPPSVARP
jgi:hypothetical protein